MRRQISFTGPKQCFAFADETSQAGIHQSGRPGSLFSDQTDCFTHHGMLRRLPIQQFKQTHL